MQSFRGSIRLLQTRNLTGLNIARFESSGAYKASRERSNVSSELFSDSSPKYLIPKLASFSRGASEVFGSRLEKVRLPNIVSRISMRGLATVGDSSHSTPQHTSESISNVPQRIKFKRLDKTAKNIMLILDKEAVEEVRAQREIPEIKPGCYVQLKVEVPENKRRVSTVKGLVIARRNAGLNSTFRIRRLVAGVGVESLYPLYSPNLKEIKVLEKEMKKVRRAKLYYLRDRVGALKK